MLLVLKIIAFPQSEKISFRDFESLFGDDQGLLEPSNSLCVVEGLVLLS